MKVANADADFRRHGLTQEVKAWEDGRRKTNEPEAYEWWYLDAVLDDGGVVVVWFGDNWLTPNKRKISIEYTPAGGETRRETCITEEPGSFSTESADTRIGKSFFRGDLDDYRVYVDSSENNGLGCNLNLRRRIVSYRPGTGIWVGGKSFFRLGHVHIQGNTLHCGFDVFLERAVHPFALNMKLAPENGKATEQSSPDDDEQRFWVYKRGQLVLMAGSNPGDFSPTRKEELVLSECSWASGQFMSVEWEPRVRIILKRACDLVDFVERLEDRRYAVDLTPPSASMRALRFL
ncbi:MAG: hypothetical protein GY822_08835 [Deltaproteobacteria bacterium]|nr:hypothetical protein [Deltaproteobacteria bacterium]